MKYGAIFSKIGGLNGWAFTVVLSTNVIQIAYKTKHKKKQKKLIISLFRSKKLCFKKH